MLLWRCFFFEYGVVVFFGLEERFEKDIIEDVEKADMMKRTIGKLRSVISQYISNLDVSFLLMSRLPA